MEYSDKKIRKLLDGIYDGSIDEYKIPEDLYMAIADYLKKALYKGFGGELTQFEGKDLQLLTELRENVYMFSAAKSYQQLKDISSLMFDKDGELVSESQFMKAGRESFSTWNDDYARTEYVTAQASATMAVKWNEIEKNKDILPSLEYSTIGDACDICAPLNGMKAAVSDPCWNDVMPPNHFNCLCTVMQIEEEIEEKADVSDSTDNMDDTFKMNSGKDGYIFSDDHPYFDVSKGDKTYAKNNFDLPIPEKD